MKILLISASPFSFSAYAQQATYLAEFLTNQDYEVFYYGMAYEGTPTLYKNFKLYGNLGKQHVGLISHYVEFLQPDIILTIKDPMAFPKEVMKRTVPWLAFAPIDTEPISPGVKSVLQHVYKILTPTYWSQAEFAAIDFKAEYTPHGIDLGFWQPGESKLRQREYIDSKDFVVSLVGDNNEYPSRKNFDIALLAWQIFCQRHKDVVLYLYTNLDGPLNLADMLNTLHIPANQFRIVNQGLYRQGPSLESVRDVYRASNVHLQISGGEGFSLTAVEAQACNLPIIGTNFTALRETIMTGWKLDPDNPGQGDIFWHPWLSFRYRPHHMAVVECLEQAYAMFKSGELQTLDARTPMLRYDLSTVLEQYWLPIIQAAESDLCI